MSRSAKVFVKGIYAGLLTEVDPEHYLYRYDDEYYNSPNTPAVSLTMPKTNQEWPHRCTAFRHLLTVMFFPGWNSRVFCT